MIPEADIPLIENTVSGFPNRELLRARGKTWTVEHVDYALSRIYQFTDRTQHAKVEALLMELRSEILRADRERAEAARHAATDAALAELRCAVEKGPKPHWSQSPGFWVSVIAALAALVAAWPVVKGWLQ